jgi:hypothetical protein
VPSSDGSSNTIANFFVRVLNRRRSVPRHAEISDELVRKICRDLGIEPPVHT